MCVTRVLLCHTCAFYDVNRALLGPEDCNVVCESAGMIIKIFFLSFFNVFLFFLISWEHGKVNYDMSEAKGKLYLRTEKSDFSVTAKLTFSGTSYTSAIEMIQTVSQVCIISLDGKRHLWLSSF